MRIKNFLKYLCLCGILAILFIVCILVAQASGIGALVTLPLGFVAISLIYGVISYLITNRIIIPQAIHFVAWVLMFTLAVKTGNLIANSVIIAVIMSISVAVSLLTAFIVKCVKRIETEKIHAHDGKPHCWQWQLLPRSLPLQPLSWTWKRVRADPFQPLPHR